MSRLVWILLLGVAVGCGAPATDGPVATGAPAGGAEGVGFTVTPVAFNTAGAPTVELDAPGMHCGACAANICKALKEQPGVVDVKADADTKVVTVAIDDAAFETDAAITAIAEAGFGEATVHETASPVEDDAATEATGESS